MTTGQVAIVVLGVLLFFAGAMGCSAFEYKECQQTQRAALASTDEPARSLVLARRCTP